MAAYWNTTLKLQQLGQFKGKIKTVHNASPYWPFHGAFLPDFYLMLSSFLNQHVDVLTMTNYDKLHKSELESSLKVYKHHQNKMGERLAE